METAIRSGLTQSAVSSQSLTDRGAGAAPLIDPPTAAVVTAEKVKTPKSSVKSKTTSNKKSKHRSPSVSSSSSESEDSDSSSSSSGSDSESETETETTKKRSKKKGKYDSSKFLPEDKKVDNFERLMLANLRMALKLLKKERYIKGLLQHLIMVAEKAETTMFANDTLCKYDEAVRITASEKGLRSFGKIDPATIFKFLTYDGTVAAEKAKRAADSGKRQGRGRQGVMYACYAFNNASEGCKGGCGYRHICSSCGVHGHIFGDCPTRKPSAGRGKHK